MFLFLLLLRLFFPNKILQNFSIFLFEEETSKFLIFNKMKSPIMTDCSFKIRECICNMFDKIKSAALWLSCYSGKVKNE